MATLDPPRDPPSILGVPPIRDYGTPTRFARLPSRAQTAGVVLVLVGLAAFIRLHYLTGQLWSDEANTVGIASHSLTAIPGLLWHGGGAPLYFFLLHIWTAAFGASEASAHALSVLIGVASVPVAVWLAWSLFGRRAGYLAGGLFAFNGFITQYAEEARPYELMALLGLLATGAFLHVFVYRRRRGWLALLAASLALMLYTDPWGIFFWAGALLALVPVCSTSADRRGLLRDALIVFGAAAIAFVPWIPTLVHQAGSATAPWHYMPLPGANVPRKLLGSDRVDAALAVAVAAGIVPFLAARRRRTSEAAVAAALIALPLGALVIARLVGFAVPTWTVRYMAPVVAPLLLLAAMASARTGLLGLAVVVVTCAFLANPASFIPTYKSDMRDVAGEVAPYLRPGDVVLVAQPEQTPLAWYYLPRGLRYETPFGPDTHPSWMNWDSAMSRIRRSAPRALVAGLVAHLSPGQHLLLVRPLTEGASNWSQPWTVLVRRRSAELSAAVASDPGLAAVPGAFAPHYYRGSCCLASSALLYVRR